MIRQGYCTRCHREKELVSINTGVGTMWLCESCRSETEFKRFTWVCSQVGVTVEELKESIYKMTKKIQIIEEQPEGTQ